jgi:hypothetical protein
MVKQFFLMAGVLVLGSLGFVLKVEDVFEKIITITAACLLLSSEFIRRQEELYLMKPQIC